MAIWARIALIGFGALLVALALAAWIGSRRQRSAMSRLVESLIRAGSSADAAQPRTEELERLPAPEARYLRWALPRQQQIQLVRLRQIGTLRTNVRRERWMAFEAEHIVAPRSAGFVWNARVAVAPLLHVRVRDALVAGRGSGQVSLLSAFTVAADAGTPEMNSGSLHRYLAEAVWYPTALLPSAKLRWSAVDNRRALATLTEDGVTVSLEFRFADTGQVTSIYTPARWGSFDGGYKQVPWEGHFRNYTERQDMLLPTEGEVGWYLEGDWQAVWKLRVSTASYELVR